MENIDYLLNTCIIEWDDILTVHTHIIHIFINNVNKLSYTVNVFKR